MDNNNLNGQNNNENQQSSAGYQYQEQPQTEYQYQQQQGYQEPQSEFQYRYQQQQQGEYYEPTAPQVAKYKEEYEESQDVSLGEWMVTLLLMCIPCANIVLAFVWAFSPNTKKSKSNYFKATLIFMAIFIVLYIILIVVIFKTKIDGIPNYNYNNYYNM